LTAQRLGVGIVGCGLMGRELAAAIGRWAALEDHPARPQLVGVCDTNPEALAWFDRVDGVRLRTRDHHDLLADDELEVLYIPGDSKPSPRAGARLRKPILGTWPKPV
jgi:predicted dehydrogenase